MARPPVSSSRRASAPAEVAPASSIRGTNAGLARMQQETEKAAQRAEASKLTAHEPFRFYVEVGESRTAIVVDDAPVFFRSEHALQHPKTKRFNLFLPCINEVANCPACEVDSKQPYYAMYLTVIDTTPYTNGKGEVIEWSKKLLVVKLSQQKKIVREWERNQTLRGAVFTFNRDGKMDASIGNDIVFEEFADEEELQSYYTTYENKDGEIVEVIGEEPFNYEEIYPDLTESQIAMAVGLKTANDVRPARGASRRGAAAEADDNAPPPRRGGRTTVAEDEPPRRAARTAARRPVAEEEEAPAPRATRRPAAAATQEPAAPRRAARTAAPAEDDAPQRQAARRPAPARGNPLPDEPTPVDRTARRAALRSGR